MRRYKFWDKTEDIYSPATDSVTGKGRWTAEEYIKEYIPWAAIPSEKVVISASGINGALIYSYSMFKEQKIAQGLEIPEGTTDEEVLKLIEDFEDEARRKSAATPSPEERTAAALEFQNLLSI